MTTTTHPVDSTTCPACKAIGGHAPDCMSALAFVQSINGARRHQSKGSLAASWALSMLAAGKRSGGRWAYGSVDSQNSGKADAEMRRICGLIADYAASLLVKVRDEAMTLNAAYDQAREVKAADDAKRAEWLEAHA